MSDVVSLERIKSEFLGKKEEIDTLMQLFEKHNGDVAKQVGVSVGKATQILRHHRRVTDHLLPLVEEPHYDSIL